MEQKKKQVRNCIYHFVQTWWPWLLDIGAVALFVALVCSLLGCKSSKAVTERDVRDSVIYTYKTLYRDSLRVKDSTIVVYETVQRDSVVVKVDKETGEVLSTDVWHWKDSDKKRDHVEGYSSYVQKSDSVALKSKGSIVDRKVEKNANIRTEMHYTRAFVVGVGVGVVLSLLFRYRKKLICLFAKMC